MPVERFFPLAPPTPRLPLPQKLTLPLQPQLLPLWWLWAEVMTCAHLFPWLNPSLQTFSSRSAWSFAQLRHWTLANNGQQSMFRSLDFAVSQVACC
jgi:hypothetical protein